MNNIKAILAILLFLIGYQSFAQELPNFQGIDNNWAEYQEIACIHFHNVYSLDNNIRFSSIKDLDKFLCQKLGETEMDEIDRMFAYISLALDKNTPFAVVDSIMNELISFHLTRVIFKTSHSDSSGFFLNLPYDDLKLKKKEEVFIQNGKYVPSRRDLSLCLPNKEDEEDMYETDIVPITRQEPSTQDIYEVLQNQSFDAVFDGKKCYWLKKQKDYCINGIKKTKEQFDGEIEKIIETMNYIFILDMNKENTYADYLEMYDSIYRNLSMKRNDYINKLLESSNNGHYSWMDHLARDKYPFISYTFSLTDKSYLELKHVK